MLYYLLVFVVYNSYLIEFMHILVEDIDSRADLS